MKWNWIDDKGRARDFKTVRERHDDARTLIPLLIEVEDNRRHIRDGQRQQGRLAQPGVCINHERIQPERFLRPERIVDGVLLT